MKVKIRDNGKGVSEGKYSSQHKSLGIAITQKRLQLINCNDDVNFTITPIQHGQGTEVNIAIKI